MIRLSNRKIRALTATTLLVTGLFLPMSMAHAQEWSVQSALKGIVGKIGSLLSFGGNGQPANGKQPQELQTRKDMVSKIYDLTLTEQNDLVSRLDALKGLTAKQDKMRDSLTAQMMENENSFNQIRTRLENAKTVEEVKQLAADFKNWRTLVYDPKVRKVAAFTFVFEGRNVIDIARQRLDKVAGDLSDQKDLLGDNKAQADSLFSKASANVKDAEDLHNQAKTLILVALTNQDNLTNAKDAPKNLSDEIARDMSDARSFTEQSFEDVKAAYKIFLDIGKLMK